jgi:ribosomal protein S18 acetylase RimI-like enzyme
MPTDFAVFRANLSHAPAIAPLLDAYRQFYKQAPDLERARAFVTDRLSKDESVIFVAGRDGYYLGFTQLYPLFSSVNLGKAWLLNDLFVAPASRGLGVGQALLEEARRFGEETGAVALMLETATDNLPAQRLYERLGWIRETEFYTYNLRL